MIMPKFCISTAYIYTYNIFHFPFISKLNLAYFCFPLHSMKISVLKLLHYKQHLAQHSSCYVSIKSRHSPVIELVATNVARSNFYSRTSEKHEESRATNAICDGIQNIIFVSLNFAFKRKYYSLLKHKHR